MKTLLNFFSLYLLILTLSGSAHGQDTKLLLVKKNGRELEVLPEKIKVVRKDGSSIKFKSPAIHNELIITAGDTISLKDIDKITCKTYSVKSDNFIHTSTDVIGGIGILIGLYGVGSAIATNLTTYNANEPVILPLLAIAAGTGMVLYGHKLLEFPKPHKIGRKWRFQVRTE